MAMQVAERTFGDVIAQRGVGAGRAWREIALIAFGTALVAACAQVAIPVGPVPATLQTFAVLLIGAVYGSRRGAATMIAYLLEGSAGLPVFAGFGAGAARFLGPTAGYLWAFPIAAFVVGWLVEHRWDRRIWTSLAALAIGDVIILGCGFGWLAVMTSPRTAWMTGVAPFLVFNAMKIGLTATALPIGRRWISRSDDRVR